MKAVFSAPRGIGGHFIPPADKSLTHRALMLASLAAGSSWIANPLDTGDCLSTRACLAALGVAIAESGRGSAKGLRVEGVGLRGFREPAGVLDAGNSGTTLRLLCGLLAGQALYAVASGDSSLLSRPMLRVVGPLRAMGARIEGRGGGRYAPLSFLPGGELRPLSCELEVPSAQVKSALLLAALRASAPVRLAGRLDSRDHTERLFAYLGLPLRREGGALVMEPVKSIPPFEAEIPGDVSSAAFFVTAALICGRELWVRRCGLNPTRLGFIRFAGRMGARIEILEESSLAGEPAGSLHVLPADLNGVAVEEGEVPFLIDEIPLVAVLACFARGLTEVRGAGELRHKESDRIQAIAALIRALGGEITLFEDGFRLEGPQPLRGGAVDPAGDHRIAMAAAVLAAGLPGEVEVAGFDAARVSFPDFIAVFRQLGGEVR